MAGSTCSAACPFNPSSLTTSKQTARVGLGPTRPYRRAIFEIVQQTYCNPRHKRNLQTSSILLKYVHERSRTSNQRPLMPSPLPVGLRGHNRTKKERTGEWEDSNLQLPAYETGALPIELHSYIPDQNPQRPIAQPGLEPGSEVSETSVLPLHYGAILNIFKIDQRTTNHEHGSERSRTPNRHYAKVPLYRLATPPYRTQPRPHLRAKSNAQGENRI